MKKILDFLIAFINDTHLDDHVEMKYETDDKNNVTLIVIKKVIHDDEQESL